MKVLDTPRLTLRHVSEDDAEFIFELVNDPDWLRYIGDRGVRNLEDAKNYVRKGPAESYARLGFGLFLVELKADGSPIGLCGLLKRDFLPDPDLGFAVLPRFRGQGYTHEAALGVLEQGQQAFGFERFLAITSLDNEISGRLLEKLGFRFEREIEMPSGGERLKLYSKLLSTAP